MKLLFTIAFIVIFTLPVLTRAQGNLLIIPRRIVFEGGKRTQEVNLANTGTDSARFTVSMIQYRMEKDGNFKEINEPDSGQYFADKYVRFFPRTVALAPNESQVVRIQVVNTSQLQPGEYRSHMYFRALPKINTFVSEKDTAAAAGQIQIRLIPQFGLSIPVIIKIGISTTACTLTDTYLKTTAEGQFAHMQINRTGNMSVYGDIKINYVSESGAVSQIGLIKGLSVYTPNAFRTVDIKLEPKSSMNLHKGKLQIAYSAQAEAKPMKFAEAEVLLK